MIKRIVAFSIIVAVLMTFFNFTLSEADFWAKLDVAFYKLEIPIIESATDSSFEDDAVISAIQSFFRKVVAIFSTPQWVFDVATSVRFLFKCNSNTYGNGSRQYIYTKEYGWLVSPSGEVDPNMPFYSRYFTPRYPKSYFTWNPGRRAWDVSGESVDYPGGGTRW